MFSHQQLERVVQERANDWNQQLYHNYLLSQIPCQPPRWRRILGRGMAVIGTWLTHNSEWLARGVFNATGITQGEYSNKSE